MNTHHCQCEICQFLREPEAGPELPTRPHHHLVRRYLVQVEMLPNTRLDLWLFRRELQRHADFVAGISSGGPIPRITITEEA